VATLQVYGHGAQTRIYQTAPGDPRRRGVSQTPARRDSYGRNEKEKEKDMTVMRGEGDVTVQTDHPPLGRTFAMTLFSVGNGVMLATLVYFVIVLALPIAADPGAPPIPPFVAFTAIFAVIGALSVFWSGTRHRPWFWLVAAIPAVLIVASNAPFIAHDINHPANTPEFLVTVGAVSGGLAIIIGGLVAFREVRRGEPAWTSSGRAGWVSIAVTGVVVGAAVTSILAGLASAGGARITEAPTLTGALTAEETRFVTINLEMDSGDVLGLFVTNKDSIGHTFDIDSLDIHVELPANSTTAVAIAPTGPGSLEIYCSVPGHREAGMVATIDVNA
jgi:plastocyanin